MSPSSRWLGISRAACRENVVVGTWQAVCVQLPASSPLLGSDRQAPGSHWFQRWRAVAGHRQLDPDRGPGPISLRGADWLDSGLLETDRRQQRCVMVQGRQPASRLTCNVQRARLCMYSKKSYTYISTPYNITSHGDIRRDASCMHRSALPQPLELCFVSAKETSPCETPVRAAGSQAGSDEYGRCHWTGATRTGANSHVGLNKVRPSSSGWPSSYRTKLRNADLGMSNGAGLD